MKAGTLVKSALVVGVLLYTRVAPAQSTGFAIDRFEPAERGSDFFVNESLDLRGKLRPAVGVVVDWAYQPLVLYERGNVRGSSQGDVLTDQIFVHAGGALVLADRFRVAANLPLAIYQHGEEIAPVALGVHRQSGAGVGDLRLSGDARVLGTYGQEFTAAVGFQLHLPTGSRDALTSDGTVRLAPRVLLAGELEWFLYAAKGGFAYRPFEGTFEGNKLGSEFIFSAAVGVKVSKRFTFGPEFYGSTVVVGGDGAFRRRNTPLEILFGAHVTLADQWQAGLAIGPGLTRGDGSPKMRVLFSVELAPDVDEKAQ